MCVLIVFCSFLFSPSPPDGNVLIFLFLDRTWYGDGPGAGFPSLPLSWAFAVMHPHAIWSRNEKFEMHC